MTGLSVAMPKLVTVGEVAGPYGVQGWVRLRSYTDPPQNILKYTPWTLESASGSRLVELAEGRRQGVAVVARIVSVDDREQAAGLRGSKILVDRKCFPSPPAGSYYWADLVGLEVYTLDGVGLGNVAGLLETGANDVLEVEGERDRLIPFVMDHYVRSVNLEEGRITVDWDPEF